ncbi:MAG: beta-N-acetylhexosaminidase [Deltaproteobacteria bacterium]|nr:beta-N-acetylhexosaminidase [Deltaproteobacteria bacterium]
MNTTLGLSELNLRVGQLFMVGIPGTSLDEDTEALIRDYNLCGVILFARNIEDPLQLARLCRDLQDAAIKYHGLPLFLAVDQEGGRVARLREPFTSFPGNEAIGMDDNPIEKAVEFGMITAREMKMVGLNMDLAPVVDVRRGEPEKHLKGRTFSDNCESVALLGRCVIRALQENGVMAVAKHFPGLGRARIDPHYNLPRIEVDTEEMEKVNIPPFKAAIEEGVSGIMTSHALYPALDSEQPATLSFAILTTLLREKMGFDGLIMTDDLEMGAIAEGWGVAEGALASFEAGADILLICEDQKNVLGGLTLMRNKLLKDEIPKKRLVISNERIIKVRTRLLESMEDISLADVKRYFKISA